MVRIFVGSRRPWDSEAFATWSYDTNFAQPRSAATLVKAAVNVVLPWSTWPIVPTFTCGLLRSNFSFAMTPESSLGSYRSAGRLGHDLFAHGLRRLLVVRELHAVVGAPLRLRPEVGRVAEHLRQRHLGRDHLRVAARLHRLDAPAASGDVADHVGPVLLGRRHVVSHDRLELPRL